MDKREIGIAVIGAGRAGMIHARNYARGIAGARLVAVVDPVEGVARAAADELSISKFYSCECSHEKHTVNRLLSFDVDLKLSHLISIE